ncbi:MAG: rhodanese-like domain-containing protein [Chloroflexi bacterium]|nr:rhodanese-like domain-containing protein [Chloroflexota bacterium]
MHDPSRVPTITVIEAHQRLGTSSETTGPLLVDVREPSEILQARAVGMVTMPLSTFMLRHRELPTDRALLMICRSGSRSAQAAAFLLANGWTDVENVAGGMLSWEQSGLSIRRGPLAPGEGDLPG